MTIAPPDISTIPGIRKNGGYCNGNCEYCDCRHPEDDTPEVAEDW